MVLTLGLTRVDAQDVATTPTAGRFCRDGRRSGGSRGRRSVVTSAATPPCPVASTPPDSTQPAKSVRFQDWLCDGCSPF